MGLIKDNLVMDAEQYLYIDPSLNNQIVSWNGITRTNDIDNRNIINKFMRYFYDKEYVKLLIDKYFDLESSSITTNTNLSIETEVEKKVEVEKEVVVQTKISNIVKKELIETKNTNVYLEYIGTDFEFKDSLVLLKNFKKFNKTLSNIFIIYEHEKNNIFIADNTVFDTFLSFVDERKLIQDYTLISLKNKFVYGYNNGNEDFQKKIECCRIFIKEFINDFYSNMKPDGYSITFDDMKFIKNNESLYSETINPFIENIYVNDIYGGSIGGESNFYKIKYLKYKSKYLNLFKKISK
jgi:hypothetical protein